MERAAAKSVGCQAILWAAALFMVLPTLCVLASENGDTGDDQSTVPRFYFEPIAGLTTARHLAPSQTAVPLGTVLELFLDAPEDVPVILSGATVTSRNADGLAATCLLDREGPTSVTAIGERSDGTKYIMATCRFDVISIDIGDISATVATPTIAPFDLDENASNEETWSYYSGESIADLVETTLSLRDAVGIDGGRRRPDLDPITRRFHTSISRRINFHVDVDPPAFAPLMEWRIDELEPTLGTEREVMFRSVGEHTISVGPPDRMMGAVIDTYSVSITSHRSGEDIVPQGESITLTAVTEPPGYQDGITWLSSTKYGTGAPVRGQGATFTVQFDNTWGDHPTNGYFQWLGLRADDARFNQDEKCIIGIGIAFDSEDSTPGGAPIVFLYDDLNGAELAQGDVIVEYRGNAIDSSVELLSVIESLEDVADGAVVSLQVKQQGQGDPVEKAPVAKKIKTDWITASLPGHRCEPFLINSKIYCRCPTQANFSCVRIVHVTLENGKIVSASASCTDGVNPACNGVVVKGK